jgi:cytochrome P450
VGTATAFPLGASARLSELEDDPHPLLARLREREPVSFVPALGGWLVTRYDLAVAVLRDPGTFTVQDERFSTGQVIGPSMLSLDGAAHGRHRAPFAAPLRPGAVRERFAAAIDDECQRLLDELAPAGRCELRARFAGPLAAGVLTRALGLPPGDTGAVRRAYAAIVSAVNEITAGRPLPEAGVAAYSELAARLAPLAGGDGPAGALLREAALAAGDGLSVTELVSNAAVLLFGGIETTEAMIANAVAMLLADPSLTAAARADAGRLDRVLEESLRLEPAAALVDRYTTAATRLGGVAIAAGELVRVSLAAANRDPAVFTEPDRLRLDPPRAPRQLAFAQGPHVCLGVHLARLETRSALAALLHRLPGLRLAPGQEPRIRGLVFRKPPELWVQWDRAG